MSMQRLIDDLRALDPAKLAHRSWIGPSISGRPCSFCPLLALAIKQGLLFANHLTLEEPEKVREFMLQKDLDNYVMSHLAAIYGVRYEDLADFYHTYDMNCWPESGMRTGLLMLEHRLGQEAS